MPPRSKTKKPRSESEASASSDEDEQVAVKSEPLDRSDGEDDEAASLPDDFTNFLLAAEVVKVKIDSDDAEEDADTSKKRRLRRKKVPVEAEETSEKDEPKRRRRRQKLTYRSDSDSDDDEDEDPEFTPSRRRRCSTAKAAKKKTPSRSPRRKKKATETTEEEGDAGESGDSGKAKPKRKRSGRTQSSGRKRVSEMTPEELAARREKWRLEMQKKRASLSAEEIEKRRAIDRERKRMKRAEQALQGMQSQRSPRKRVSDMTPEELLAYRERWRTEKKKIRENLTPEEIARRKEEERKKYANMTPEEIEEKKKQDRERMRNYRKEMRKKLIESNDPAMMQKLQEQAQRRAMKKIQRMAEMTEEEKNQLRMERYMRHVAKMSKMTPEEKEEHRRKAREKMKERYYRLTPEEKKRNNYRRNLVRNRVLENGLTKRENDELRKMEKLKARGEWEAYVRRRRERKLQIKQAQKLTGKKYVYHTHFLTPEDEARFKARKRLNMQRFYIKKKMTAAGASQEEIERKLNELMEANPQDFKPRKPGRRKNSVPTDFEIGNKAEAQTTPQSHQSQFSPETDVKDDGATATTSSNLHLSFNPFTMRWGATLPEPTRQEPNFSQNLQANAAPTATPSTSSSFYNLNSLINPPPAHQQCPTFPNPNQIHQHQPHNDHQSFTELMDSASSSHYEYDNDDSFSDSFSPAPYAPQASAILPPPQPTNSGPALKFTELRRESECSEVKPDAPNFSPPKKPSPQRKNKTKISAGSEGHTIPEIPDPSVPAKPIRPKKNIPLPYRPPTRERNSKCRVCGNHYSMKTLKEHMKDVHHPYFQGGICTICGIRFVRPRDFHKHFKLHGGSGSVFDDTVTYSIPYDGTPPVPPPEPEKKEPTVPAKPPRKRRRHERPLNQPTRYSSGERNCRCNECGNLYARGVIKQHIRRVHHPYYQKGKCTICEEELRKPEHFFNHFREAHGGMGDACLGNVTYTVIPDGEMPKPPPPVDSAEREVIGEYVLCDVCGNKYRARYIALHKKNYHPQHFQNGECTLCGEKFPKGPKYFMQHFNAVHVGKDVPKEPSKYKRGQGNVICQDCGKTCSNKYNLEEHWHYAHGPGSLEENFFKCTICPDDVRIKMRQSFNKHYREFHPNEPIPGPYQCPYVFKTGCTMTFIQEKKVGEHLVSQHPDLCFTCQYCHKAWAFEISLNFHYIKCLPMPREEFRKFRKTVGENSFDKIPVKCELCQAETTLKGLRMHYETGHGAKESKFRCLKCDKTFNTREFLAAHITDFHGLMPDEYIDALSKLNVTDRTGISVEQKKITKTQPERRKTIKKVKTKRLRKEKPTRKTPGRRSKKKVETSESEDEEEDRSQSEADVSKDQSDAESSEDDESDEDEATNDKVDVKKEIVSDAEDGVLEPIIKMEIEDSDSRSSSGSELSF